MQVIVMCVLCKFICFSPPPKCYSCSDAMWQHEGENKRNRNQANCFAGFPFSLSQLQENGQRHQGAERSSRKTDKLIEFKLYSFIPQRERYVQKEEKRQLSLSIFNLFRIDLHRLFAGTSIKKQFHHILVSRRSNTFQWSFPCFPL